MKFIGKKNYTLKKKAKGNKYIFFIAIFSPSFYLCFLFTLKKNLTYIYHSFLAIEKQF